MHNRNNYQVTNVHKTKIYAPKFANIGNNLYLCNIKLMSMAIKSRQSRARMMRESKMIFASSCVESAARQRNISTSEMYLRMKRVGLIDGFILKCYEGLHTQSRQHVTEDVLGALDIWEAKMGVAK